jgi:hypothetical protein
MRDDARFMVLWVFVHVYIGVDICVLLSWLVRTFFRTQLIVFNGLIRMVL